MDGRYITESGIDYLTVTLPANGLETRDTYERLKEIHIRKDWGGQVGVEESTWRWNGYVGKKVGRLLWGCRDDGSIIRVSSSAAQTVAVALQGTEWRASRIDLQATVRLAGQTPDSHIKDMSQRAVMARAGAVGAPVKIAHINGYGAGDTLSIGSRASDVYLRLYNKQAESEHSDYTQCVRVEVEAKSVRARNLYWAWGVAQDKPAFVLETLQAIAQRRGVETLEGLTGAGGIIPLGRTESTNLESRLLWLASSVKPAVDKLVAAGWRQDVLDALGLSEVDALPAAQAMLM